MSEQIKVWVLWSNGTRTLAYLSDLARYEALYGPHPFNTQPYEP